MKRTHRAFARVLAATKLDTELQPRVSLLELAGDRRILIENHVSVVHYSTQQVLVRVDFGQLCIKGSALRLTRLGKEQLVIMGQIDAIKLCREGCQ